MAVTVLAHSCLKFSDISLFTMHVVTYIQTCNLDIIKQTILHTTHQYMPQGLGPLGLKMLRLDCIQGVTGGTDQTLGECSLGHTIPI